MDKQDRNLLRAQLLIEAADILNEDAMLKSNVQWLKDNYNYRPLNQRERKELEKKCLKATYDNFNKRTQNRISNRFQYPDEFSTMLTRDFSDGTKFPLGYITVNGKQILVSAGSRGVVTGGSTNTAAIGPVSSTVKLDDKNIPFIQLGGRSFKKLSDKEKHAILMHEVGHLELKHTDARLKRKLDFKDTPEKKANSVVPESRIRKAEDKAKKNTDKNIFEKMIPDSIEKKKYSGYKVGVSKSDAQRIDNIPRMSKYIVRKNEHSHPMEIEADIYSAEHGRDSGKSLISGLKKVTKNVDPYQQKLRKAETAMLKSSIAESDMPSIAKKFASSAVESSQKRMYKKLDKLSDKETKAREKALSDKKINHEPYKK